MSAKSFAKHFRNNSVYWVKENKNEKLRVVSYMYVRGFSTLHKKISVPQGHRMENIDDLYY